MLPKFIKLYIYIFRQQFIIYTKIKTNIKHILCFYDFNKIFRISLNLEF